MTLEGLMVKVLGYLGYSKYEAVVLLQRQKINILPWDD